MVSIFDCYFSCKWFQICVCTLQMYFTAQISSLVLGGCWLELHGMSSHQSGQRHILAVTLFYFYLVWYIWFPLHYASIDLLYPFFLTKNFTYWDDWLRLKENHKGRQFIRPEVCRTYNFGEHVCISTHFFEMFLVWYQLKLRPMCYFVNSWAMNPYLFL